MFSPFSTSVDIQPQMYLVRDRLHEGRMVAATEIANLIGSWFADLTHSPRDQRLAHAARLGD